MVRRTDRIAPRAGNGVTRRLLADVGGTRTRFALLEGDRLGAIESVPTGAYSSAVDAFHHFLNGQAEGVAVEEAVIAAAGPVSGGRCKLTNASWVLETEQLQRNLSLRDVTLVNDLAALAWGVPNLADGDVVALGDGYCDPGSPVVLLAPGTGLGVACYIPGVEGPQVLSSEGGHATLAAGDAAEASVIDFLRRRFDHVSAERVLSGSGLVNLYDAIGGRAGGAGALTPEEIVRGALQGDNAQAGQAVDMFCGFLGSFAGDLALLFGAKGGVLLGGGIGPRLVSVLQHSAFREKFVRKGRFEPYVARIATRIIVRPEPTFVGLKALALRNGP
jgi:glucokinase